MNSFKSIETERQIELLERGEKIIQETRGWNDAKGRISLTIAFFITVPVNRYMMSRQVHIH
ncbi:MAG: hypothetical protein WDN66_04875 [Candidatus Saccharibacteria bacterium]